MIYSYTKIKTAGPNGTTLGYVYAGDGEEDPAIILGDYNGRTYLYAPDDADLGKQDKKIKFQEDEITAEAKPVLRAQYGAGLKNNTRATIEREVGDTLDLLSDTGKILETATVSAAFAVAVLGGKISASDPRLEVYAARAAAILESIENGTLLIRGSFDDPDSFINQTAPRYTRLQQIVKDKYHDPLSAVGLA